MSKFIEVTVYGRKRMVALSTIESVSDDFGTFIVFKRSSPDWLPIDESYEEIKRLIWGAE